MNLNKTKKTHVYAFDFDGVIAHYHGFKGHNVVGKPINEVVKAIRVLKKQGHRILIYSTRGDKLLRGYCKKYRIPVDYFNRNPEVEGKNPHKPITYAYIDDRAVCYQGQTAKKLVRQLNSFRTYWR